MQYACQTLSYRGVLREEYPCSASPCLCLELEVNRSAEASAFKPQGFDAREFLAVIFRRRKRSGSVERLKTRFGTQARRSRAMTHIEHRTEASLFSTAIYQPSAISNLITPQQPVDSQQPKWGQSGSPRNSAYSIRCVRARRIFLCCTYHHSLFFSAGMIALECFSECRGKEFVVALIRTSRDFSRLSPTGP